MEMSQTLNSILKVSAISFGVIMWLSVVVALVASCVFLWKVLSRDRVGGGREPPEFPGALPLIGHSHLFASGDSVYLWKLLKKITAFAQSKSDVAGFRIAFKQSYMVADLDDCVTVANSALDKSFVYDFMKVALGEGLFTGKVPIWKPHRKLLTPAFSQVVLDGFMGVFNSQAVGLVSALEQESGKEPFDGWSYIGPNALETICLTAMGGSQVDKELRNKYMQATEVLYNTVIQRFQKFWLHNEYTFKLSSIKKIQDDNVKIVHDVSYSVLNERKRNLGEGTTIVSEKSGSKFKAFIDLIIEYSGKDGLLTDQEIREEVDTIIIAGHDTSASTTMYALILLGSYPAVQERVLQEIEEVVRDIDVNKQHLPRLVYLEAVIKETLRLYPIAPFIVRNLKKNLELKNYTLPAGSDVYLAYFALQRHKVWGPDAHEFAPERWLDKSRVPDHQAAFSAFSIGRRMCIGKSYALMNMKTVLVHLIRSYRFKSDVSKLELKIDVMLKPHAGHYISIERRT